jgi:hypothetical protein
MGWERMAGRASRRLWKAITASCCVAFSAVWLAGCLAAGRATGPSRAPDEANVPGSPHGVPLSVLQFNLCDSGIAGCYTGRSVQVAAAVIEAEQPTVVTLNEVCRSDVSVLAHAMAREVSLVASAFRAAVDPRTGAPIRCVNGQRYGVAVLALLPTGAARYHAYGGVYPTQDAADPEERVWLCIDVPVGYLACTTHTASTSAAVALLQCRFLLDSALPSVRRRTGEPPVIVGADLNLPADGLPGPQSCLPPGYQRADDGSLQDVIATPGAVVRSRTVIDMRGSTDHPGLLVRLVLP